MGLERNVGWKSLSGLSPWKPPASDPLRAYSCTLRSHELKMTQTQDGRRQGPESLLEQLPSVRSIVHNSRERDCRSLLNLRGCGVSIIPTSVTLEAPRNPDMCFCAPVG